MKRKKNICIIGEVVVDLTLENNQENKLRLGGIFNAARALWALDVNYDFLYIAPTYLKNEIHSAIQKYNGTAIEIGIIENSPNLILINDRKESGNQGYELLLNESSKCTLNLNNLESYLKFNNYTDIIIFSGEFEINKILSLSIKSDTNMHIDVSNQVKDLTVFNKISNKINTFITSTSSEIFLKYFNSSITEIIDKILGKISSNILLKENRGGSRFVSEDNSNVYCSIGAQIRKTEHSVGVGDCYNVVYVALKDKYDKEIALNYSSWIASEYASTTFPEDFKRECKRILSIKPTIIMSLKGIILPWEKRNEIDIYIAAPDFDYIDTKIINKLGEKLRYHNFNPRFPIKENGQMGFNPSKEHKKTLFFKDINLLNNCKILVAVLLYNDPGTLIEIGYAYANKIPVIVYDPYSKAENLMLTELPTLLTNKIEEVIEKVYEISSRIIM